MTTPIISVRDLGFAYGDVVALHHVDLDVPPGRIGLVGANGAGKSTFIKILLGILKPQLGTVAVLGEPIPEKLLDVRSVAGYMPEARALPLDQTAADFLVFAAELAGIPPRAARQRASDVLTLVGLHEERFRYLGEFSTGMKQRAMLAQAIVHDPTIVFLDEPTAGLDPEGRDEMLDLIARLGGFGINVMTSTHVLSDVERTCDWVVMLDGGTVLRSGPIADLGDSDVVEVEVVGDPGPVAEELRRRGASVELAGRTIAVRVRDGDPYDVIRDVIADLGATLRRMESRSTSLEDVFLAAGRKEEVA